MNTNTTTDDNKYGTPWRDDELDLIIADYFVMLGADIAEIPYVKSRHSAALMARIGRSHRSVEFKHQNISAVLEALGLPWIPGYVPKRNYQNAIFDALDRYLSQHQDIFKVVPALPQPSGMTSEIFVAPPIPVDNTQRMPMRLERLVRKFDPVERDHRNRALGKAGEEFVFYLERERLEKADRPDLASKVRWIAEEDGDGAGYDVLSFDTTGSENLIEVKTTNGASRTPFFLTRNERDLSSERPKDWRIYRVHMFAKSPRIFTMLPPLDGAAILRTETWRVSF